MQQKKKIKGLLIIPTGIECTGKTTLSCSLARYFNTVYLEEAGRDISVRSGSNIWMLPEDNTDILLQTKVTEQQLLMTANHVLFYDTDCVNTLFYMEYFNSPGKEYNQPLAESIAAMNSYDLVLLLAPDIPFVQDGDRSTDIANNREKYTEHLKSLYEKRGFKVEYICGDYHERYVKSVALVEEMLHR